MYCAAKSFFSFLARIGGEGNECFTKKVGAIALRFSDTSPVPTYRVLYPGFQFYDISANIPNISQ